MRRTDSSKAETTPLDPKSVSAWLQEAVGELLEVAPADVDPAVRFRELGLESAQITSLVARLSDRLGLPLPPTTPWEHPTPLSLSRHVAAMLTRDEPPSPFPDRASVPKRPMTPALQEPIAIVGMSCRLPGGVCSPA